ncbi:DUF1990 family protein [Nocardioides marmoraquaticus]
MGDRLTYDDVGATRPDLADWPATPPTYRRLEDTWRIGHGADSFERAGDAVLAWAVKTRSGFDVLPPGPARAGCDVLLVARLGPVSVREPARVVAVHVATDRRGFAYGTRPGHPVSGEEAFVVHRDAADQVWLTVRSLTRPGRAVWRAAFPGLVLAQRAYRRRYARALVD